MPTPFEIWNEVSLPRLTSLLGGDQGALALVHPLSKPAQLGAKGDLQKANALQTTSALRPGENLVSALDALAQQSPDAPQLTTSGSADSGARNGVPSTAGSIDGSGGGGDGSTGTSGATGDSSGEGSGDSGDGGPGGAAGDP